MKSQTIAYGNSKARTALTWLVYPLFVLLPFTWLLFNFDFDKPAILIGFAFLSLFTTGIMEWVHPHTLRWRRSHGDIRTDLTHQVLTAGLSQVLRGGMVFVFFWLLTWPVESYALVPWPTTWPLWAQALLGLIVAEFGYYWRHRLFHEWLPGWRFHCVHHSSRRLYFLNGVRFQIFDIYLAGLAGAITLALAGATAEVAALVGIFTSLHGNWQHANVRYKLGWLNWIIAGAELHRWHHSSMIRHTNSNYGNNLILFDILFGTRCLPAAPQNVEQIGLGDDDAHFPRTWWRQQLVPFQWQSPRHADRD